MAAPGTPKATSTPASSITFTTAPMMFMLGIGSLLFPGLTESRDLVLREILDDPQERGVVLAAPALPLHRQEHLIHDRRYGQHHAVLPARRERYTEVPVVQLRPETGIELVGEELLPLDLHDLVAGEASREDVEDFFGGDPAFGTQNQRLADSLDGERHHYLVGRLGYLAGSRGPDVVHGGPHHLKERPRALEVLLASPHHDRERPLYGTDVSAANRGVQHGSPALFDLRCQLLGHNGGDGAHVNEERTFLDPLQHPALAGDHITHVR